MAGHGAQHADGAGAFQISAFEGAVQFLGVAAGGGVNDKIKGHGGTVADAGHCVLNLDGFGRGFLLIQTAADVKGKLFKLSPGHLGRAQPDNAVRSLPVGDSLLLIFDTVVDGVAQHVGDRCPEGRPGLGGELELAGIDFDFVSYTDENLRRFETAWQAHRRDHAS